MWINGKFLTEAETISYISELKAERDKYRAEYIEVLRAASTCLTRWEKGDEADCSKCRYESWDEECPVGLTRYEAKFRLREMGVNDG